MTKYERLSVVRKTLQKDGLAPSWYTTAGYQLLTEKNYLNVGETPLDMYNRIANRAAELTKFKIPEDWGFKNWNEAFFNIMWNGYLSPSSPVLSNMGNDRGHPISCSGTHMGDSISEWYESYAEIAKLTQRGYGTSACLDSVRSRGSEISKGGSANGVMQPANDLVNIAKNISQGNNRRGAIGIYLDPMHGDFDELADQILADDDSWNIGWNITDAFEELFTKDYKSANAKWEKMLKVKLVKGKGYFLFTDKVNRHSPKMYKDRNLTVKHSNLCSEILLFNDKDHSFTCVLSSMNITKYNEWKDTKAVEIATVFLDSVIEDMLIKARTEKEFKRTIAFTEKTRALGLGQLGLSTYYQQEGLVFGELQTIMFNQQLTKLLSKRSLYASQLMAKELGEPEFMVGYGERNSHRLSFPPTMSTSVIMGGVSQGIEPTYANVFEQDTAGGSVYRINPPFLKLMKTKGMYNKEVMERIANDQGSVQAEDWLTEDEKKIYKTAFEINQERILKMASDRTKNGLDQGQSINLYFTADESEEEISRIHNIAFKDEDILGLYYVRTLNDSMQVIVPKEACEACNG